MSVRKRFDPRSALPGSPFLTDVYLLDGPEAALSPQRQLAFLRMLYGLTAQKIAQFVMATHSPILLTFPGATIFSLDAGKIGTVAYQETDHFKITRNFLNAPERYYRHLFDQGD
jgi:predicted ATPase